MPADLKPGVSLAEIVIVVITLKIPIQSVTTVDGKQVVFKQTMSGPNPCSEVGLFNTKFIEVLDGVDAEI